MQVSHVPLRPSAAATADGVPALTPSEMAAVSARYSRSDEGLDAILGMVSQDEDATSRIFRFIDYGHASVGDLAHIALFFDDIPMALAMLLFHLSPVAAGQECSTRYITWDKTRIAEPLLTGVAPSDYDQWLAAMDAQLALYEDQIALWTGVASQLELVDSKASPQKAARIRRNFVLDKTRWYLPLGMKTGCTLQQSVRQWVSVARTLKAHWMPGAQWLGQMICNQVARHVPELGSSHLEPSEHDRISAAQEWKHFWTGASSAKGFSREPRQVTALAEVYRANAQQALVNLYPIPETPQPAARYDRHPDVLRLLPVGMTVLDAPIGVLRDLNRHRTGERLMQLAPTGWWCPTQHAATPSPLMSGEYAMERLQVGDASYLAWTTLGTQMALWHHLTSAANAAYMIELRTSPDADPAYAEIFRQFHKQLVHQDIPAETITCHLPKPSPFKQPQRKFGR